jgi:hypothetical protein
LQIFLGDFLMSACFSLSSLTHHRSFCVDLDAPINIYEQFSDRLQLCAKNIDMSKDQPAIIKLLSVTTLQHFESLTIEDKNNWLIIFLHLGSNYPLNDPSVATIHLWEVLLKHIETTCAAPNQLHLYFILTIYNELLKFDKLSLEHLKILHNVLINFAKAYPDKLYPVDTEIYLDLSTFGFDELALKLLNKINSFLEDPKYPKQDIYRMLSAPLPFLQSTILANSPLPKTIADEISAYFVPNFADLIGRNAVRQLHQKPDAIMEVFLKTAGELIKRELNGNEPVIHYFRIDKQLKLCPSDPFKDTLWSSLVYSAPQREEILQYLSKRTPTSPTNPYFLNLLQCCFNLGMSEKEKAFVNSDKFASQLTEHGTEVRARCAIVRVQDKRHGNQIKS